MASDRKMIGLRVVAGFTLNVILSKVGGIVRRWLGDGRYNGGTLSGQCVRTVTLSLRSIVSITHYKFCSGGRTGKWPLH
jgi:hypothetical protein